MKIKKFLEKAAEEDRESLINDRDTEFLASIGVDYNKKREAAKKEPDSSYYRTVNSVNYKLLFTGIALFLIVAITAVSLSVYFSLKPSPAEQPIHYFEDNFVEVDSNLQELNDDLQLFDLKIEPDEYDVSIKRIYDSLSGDNLYFSLDFTAKQGLGKKFELDIVVNKLYEHEDLSYMLEIKEGQIAEYIIKYTENSKPMNALLVNVDCMGEMQIGEQWIYITKYNEKAVGHSTFIETLQSLISFK